jgi:signal transduction histidine kinase
MSPSRSEDDPVRAWIEEGTAPPDPERVRSTTEGLVGAIYRRGEVDEATLDALLELLSHEIRTPFAVIEGSARLLAQDADRLEDEHVQLAHNILSHATLGLLLLDRLAEVRAVDHGNIALERVPVDIAEFLEKTVENLHAVVVGTRPVQILSELDEPVVAHVDVRRMRQIVFNLLANAAVNTPPDALIRIELRRRGDVLEVEVRDEGHGVAPAQVDTIFEKFPRLGAARQGPGVGLFVSRGLARAHGGDLRTEPAEKQGGIFVLSLPL